MPLNIQKTKISRPKILLVDDHVVFREGLRKIITKGDEFLVCAETGRSEEALELIADHRPDLVIMDVSIGEANGLELTRHLKKSFPALRILVVSMHEESIYAGQALKAGAMGYVMKREPPEKLLSAIRLVLQGQWQVSPAVWLDLLNRLPEIDGLEEEPPPGKSLSDRELQVFRFIGKGRGTRQIAEELKLSIKTVESYRAHIKEKMQYASSYELVKAAIVWAQKEKTG